MEEKQTFNDNKKVTRTEIGNEHKRTNTAILSQFLITERFTHKKNWN